MPGVGVAAVTGRQSLARTPAKKTIRERRGCKIADRDTEDFLTSYLKELNENNVAVFIGAGMSKAAGYVDWSGLMSPVAKGLGLDVAKESDLVALAQYHLNANNNNRHKLSQLLIDEFSDLKNPTENHSLLASRPRSRDCDRCYS